MPQRLAEAAIDLLSDDDKRQSLARAAYRRGREMLWPRVVERSLAPLGAKADRPSVRRMLPRPSALPLDAIERMTDGVGMLQHAVFSVPEPRPWLLHRRQCPGADDGGSARRRAGRRRWPRSIAAFLQHGWNPDMRRFRNFMGYDRQWLEACGSEDSNGRTLWALGDGRGRIAVGRHCATGR